MTGFDDAFDAQMAHRRRVDAEADAAASHRRARIAHLRKTAIAQITAAGRVAVRRLRAEAVPSVHLWADRETPRRFRKPLINRVPVAEGWPLGAYTHTSDNYITSHNFHWFLHSDGRVAHDDRPTSIGGFFTPTGTVLDQLATFERYFTETIEKIDIVVPADPPEPQEPYLFGGLTQTGRPSTYPPRGFVFDGDADTLCVPRYLPGSRRLISLEEWLGGLVADEVLHPAIHHWPRQ